jgi:hypothetical protein
VSSYGRSGVREIGTLQLRINGNLGDPVFSWKRVCLTSDNQVRKANARQEVG